MSNPNPSPVARIAVTVLFVGLIAGAYVLNQRNVRDTSRPGGAADPAALERYGFRLKEVSADAGIDFVHQPPQLDPKLAPIHPRVADMGASVAIGDFDKDGWQDLYVTDSKENSANKLYRNLGDGKFEEVAVKMGVADLNRDGTGVSMGALWGDFDNNGFEDLLVYKWGRSVVFLNQDGKGFREVGETSGLPRWMNANTATLLDYDSDGKLDVLMCGYFDESVDLWKLKDTRIMPDSLEYATNGTRKYLLRGRGDGTFEDVTQAMGMTKKAWTLAVAAADLRGTGYPDVFLANDYGKAELWVNDRGQRFREIGQKAVTQQPKSGMNAAFGDIFNDGRLSIHVSNIWEDGLLQQGNNLWVPRDGTPKGELAFDNQAGPMGLENGGWSFGAQFGDLNNDGFQDLYLVNGYISADREKSYWYDYSKFSVGHGELIRDARNWPPIRGRSLSGFQQKRVWINDGAGNFKEVAQAVGATDLLDGRAVAIADLWNRGVLDVVVANQRGRLLIYKNEVASENGWIGFSLEATKANRSAIGAMVTVHWGGQKQTQVVSGGSGFCAQNDRRLHFGLGKNPQVDKVEIRWPGGRIQTLDRPEAGKVHVVKES